MGTRADFYVGRTKDAVWLGSIAWDGYPDGITPKTGAWDEGAHLFDAKDEDVFRARVIRFFEGRDDVTLPEHGWPWPWDNSRTTDYAYAIDNGKVWACCFGKGWFDPLIPESEDENEPAYDTAPVDFPDMKDVQNIRWDKGSGVIIIGGEA